MTPHIGIVAASSVVQPVEFSIGVEHLRSRGFEVTVHPQVSAQHWMHAGEDIVRAEALFEYAHNPEIDVIWLARGGFGAQKVLPILDRLTIEQGAPPPGKLLVGYSDVTVLHEFVRQRWNWSTLHSPMPAAANFTTLPAEEWDAIENAIRNPDGVVWPWSQKHLRWLTAPPAQAVEATLMGGNLSMWQTLAATPYAPQRRPHILFLEDLSGRDYRIDRMITHVEQAGMLDTCVAMVLGDFTDCVDEKHDCLAPVEDPYAALAKCNAPRQPLRPVFELEDLYREVFTALGERRNIPIAAGLPVGHGPNFSPLPLGARYRLTPAGTLVLLDWQWRPQRG